MNKLVLLKQREREREIGTQADHLHYTDSLLIFFSSTSFDCNAGAAFSRSLLISKWTFIALLLGHVQDAGYPFFV
jgi:hypothetical protein